ncbi:hypothetical protein P7B02_17555 [Caulobacter segnis]|nr:hypothetical protein [Caulobacter segnis]MDG2523339.1 hypothetical protein [Caulobacter segnis]
MAYVPHDHHLAPRRKGDLHPSACLGLGFALLAGLAIGIHMLFEVLF